MSRWKWRLLMTCAALLALVILFIVNFGRAVREFFEDVAEVWDDLQKEWHR